MYILVITHKFLVSSKISGVLEGTEREPGIVVEVVMQSGQARVLHQLHHTGGGSVDNVGNHVGIGMFPSRITLFILYHFHTTIARCHLSPGSMAVCCHTNPLMIPSEYRICSGATEKQSWSGL